MSQLYPCPNPMCAHQFTAQDLAGVASVTCPRCGMVIQLRAAAPKPPAAPTVPMTPVAPSPPPATTVFEPGEGGPPIVRTRARPKSRDALTYTLTIGGFLLLATFGLVGAYVGFKGGVSKVLGTRGGYKNSAFNYNFDPKVPGWEENRAMQSTMGVSELVLKRGDAPAYFALDVLDYKDHNPTERELDGEARRKLKAMFPKNVEYDQTAGKPDETGAVAGQNSHRIVFHGESPEQSFVGEVVFFANQGLGYWLYALAAGDVKAFDDEFKQLRKSFSLIGERPDFKKSQQNTRVFAGEKVKGYQLTDATGRWKSQEDLTAHDPVADLVLRALDPANPKKATLAVDLIVMSLKPGGDPIAAARKHILTKYEREGNPGAKISEAGDEQPLDHVGAAKGHLMRWRINLGGGFDRFAVVGVVPRADDVLVLFGDCGWDRRYTWEAPLQQLIESLQLKE